MRTPVSLGVVGLGPWGARLARTFAASPRAELRWLCDLQALAPGVVGTAAAFTRDLDELLADETLDAIAIATPPATRHELVRRALEAEKHVYVEGPIALWAEQAEELFRLAARRNRRLLPGHALLFHPALRKLKELIELGRLGEIYYLNAVFHTAGRGAGDGHVLAGLGGAAVSSLLYLTGDEPVHAQATAESYLHPTALEFASCYLRFATGIAATLELSWLDAREQVRIVAVGSRRTAVFDDAEPLRKLTIHERPSVRGAEIVCPRLSPGEPVQLQCEGFLAGIRSTLDFPATRLERTVVRVLERFGSESLEPPAVAAPARPHLRLAARE
jgi:predicted dehydrogenase